MRKILQLFWIISFWSNLVFGTPSALEFRKKKLEIIVSVKGMVCSFCARGISEKFELMPEIENIKVSLENGTVTLLIKEGFNLQEKKITDAIIATGLSVGKIEKINQTTL